jgi:hypothetical protein
MKKSSPMRLALATLPVLTALSSPAAAEEPWAFVSLPDMFNSDVADISGATDDAIAEAFPDPAAYREKLNGLRAVINQREGKNSLNAGMAAGYNKLIAGMQERAGGDAQVLLIAGDLVNGRWPQNAQKVREAFGGDSLEEAIENASALYYEWQQELVRQHGFDLFIPAVGDHEIGDNPWWAGSPRAQQVNLLRRTLDRHLISDLDLPDIAGVPARAPVEPYSHGSYALRHKNVLFLTVDVFQQDDPDTTLHPLHGSVDGNVTGDASDPSTHLGWIKAILMAADADESIDHVVVQSHLPILDGVRKQYSSGMMLTGREDSGLWQVLREHDHRSGGKVRFYLAGEVHKTTATLDSGSDIVQLVHGSPPLGGGDTNFVVFHVEDDVMIADYYHVDLASGSDEYWQVSEGMRPGTGGVDSFDKIGSLVIDTSGEATRYQAQGRLELVPHGGRILHYRFDQSPSADGRHPNAGHFGGDWIYDGHARGKPSLSDGKLGSGLVFDGNDDFLRNMGTAPVTESEQRTVMAWVKTDAETQGQTLFGYGQAHTPNGILDLRLDAQGRLHLVLDGKARAVALNEPINDGQWHHVAAVLPNKHDNRVSDARLFVDGELQIVSVQVADGHDDRIMTYPGVNSSIHIGSPYMNRVRQGAALFDGTLDEVAFYARGLTDAQVASVVQAATEHGLNLDEYDRLLELAEQGEGSVDINGETWQAAEASDDPSFLALAEDGGGVVLAD